MSDEALFDKGMPIRREVLGAEYVDASMARADDFMMAFQRATTAWAWGWAWGDPTLDRQTRSMINLAMLTALNRAPEIKLHVKGALTNGVTVEEIKAVLLHATAYCGIPAGLDAFKAAHEVLVAEGALPANRTRDRLPEYEVFALRYAHREARRADHFIGGDPHDGPMPMDYFVWVIRGDGRVVVVDCGFNAEIAARRGRTCCDAGGGAGAAGDRPRHGAGSGADASALRSCRQPRPLPLGAVPSAGARAAFAVGRHIRHPFLRARVRGRGRRRAWCG